MLPGFPVLRFSAICEAASPLVLAPRSKAIEMCREGGWEALPISEALREFDRTRLWDFTQLRRFVADSRTSHFDLREHGDREVVDFARTCIRRGDMSVLRQGDAPGKAVSDSLELRRLLSQIEKQSGGRLSHRGSHYKLVLGEDLAKVPGRDYYEVVSQTDATRILEGIASEASALSELAAKAKEKLARDWRAPFSQPEGLVLLRRIPTAASVPRNDGPGLTPSQMQALREEEDLVLELVHLYHDDEPVHEAPFTVQLSDGTSLEGRLDGEGKATVHVSVTPVKVQFGPDNRPWEKVDQTANPDYQEELDVDAFIQSRLGPST